MLGSARKPLQAGLTELCEPLDSEGCLVYLVQAWASMFPAPL